jgi:hypothetical protein
MKYLHSGVLPYTKVPAMYKHAVLDYWTTGLAGRGFTPFSAVFILSPDSSAIEQKGGVISMWSELINRFVFECQSI